MRKLRIDDSGWLSLTTSSVASLTSLAGQFWSPYFAVLRDWVDVIGRAPGGAEAIGLLAYDLDFLAQEWKLRPTPVHTSAEHPVVFSIDEVVESAGPIYINVSDVVGFPEDPDAEFFDSAELRVDDKTCIEFTKKVQHEQHPPSVAVRVRKEFDDLLGLTLVGRSLWEGTPAPVGDFRIVCKDVTIAHIRIQHVADRALIRDPSATPERVRRSSPPRPRKPRAD